MQRIVVHDHKVDPHNDSRVKVDQVVDQLVRLTAVQVSIEGDDHEGIKMVMQNGVVEVLKDSLVGFITMGAVI